LQQLITSASTGHVTWCPRAAARRVELGNQLQFTSQISFEHRTQSAFKQSLDFTSNRLFMKLFRTGSIHVVQECRSYFGVELPSCL